jgi:hypothetical protein
LRLVERRFQIFIRRIDGTLLTLDVVGSYTVGYLKEKIQSAEHVCADQQRLLFQNNQLEDQTRTLQSYQIRSGSTLQMMARLYGG